jgi:hypothetical protein
MLNQHLFTPPLDLIEEWWTEFVRIESNPDADSLPFIASQAAKWGADKEFEECYLWVKTFYGSEIADCMKDDRRVLDSL